MTLTERFISIATKKDTIPKKSSLIHDWLGFKCTHSTSIRLGNYIETLFNQSVQCNLKCLLPDGEHIQANNQTHQIDHLMIDTDEQIWQLELKCNLTLDRGKKRDVVSREAVITEALSKQLESTIKSCVFCPFIEDSKTISSLGYIMGMKEFISRFNPDFTLTEFKLLGKNPAIHSVL
mgnify:CR=1 FL=1